MKKQTTIAHGFGTHTIACVFHDFEGFQEMTKIMKRRKTIVCRFLRDFEEFQKMMEIIKKQLTIAHGLGKHTIACIFHDF